MRDARVGKRFIDAQLRFHDGVVRRREYGVHAVRDQRLRGQRDFIDRRAGALDVLHALLREILLRGLDGARRRVLTDVIQKSDLLCVRVLGEDQIHDRGSVQIVRGAGHVAARSLQRSDQSDGYRVRDRRENHRRVRPLRRGLHAHGDRRCDRHQKVRAVCLEVGNDLRHQVCIRVAVVIEDIKLDAPLLAELFELCAEIFHDLIEGCVVHIIADTDGVVRAVRGLLRRSLSAAGRQRRREHQNGENPCDHLFHDKYQPFQWR